MGGKGAWALPSEADAYPPMAQIVFPQVGALVATPYKVLAGAFYAETAILGGAVLYSAGPGTMGLIRAAVPPVPFGMTLPQVGQLLGLGQGGLIFGSASYEVLAENGITFDMVVLWMQVYVHQ